MSQIASFFPRLRAHSQLPRFTYATFSVVVGLFCFLIGAQRALTQSSAHDPGARSGPAGSGAPIAGLTPNQRAFFDSGLDEFMQVQSVKGTVSNTGPGLGPRFNGESCAQCHAQPAVGGTSPSVNPQVAAANDQGAANQIPFFITANGPVREVRFPYTPDMRQRDGGVHALFTITGRGDSGGCSLKQPNFQQAADAGNLIFRIPTPVFGGGLIEAIPESAILAQVSTRAEEKHRMGIGGRPNRSPKCRHYRKPQHQRQRRYDYAIRLEGSKQVAPGLRRGSL